MYKRDLVRYDGNLDAIVNDVIAYAVESASTPFDSEPINVLFDLSISTDDDVPPSEAYFWRVDEVQTQTRWLSLSDAVDAIVAQLKAELARVVKVGNLVSFSINAWKGASK